ncbi:MAG: hypothetical protein COW71_07770 [Ignavibacteriales bacterium CG18_big_fil_WC_8_21_14_2_50_31_20]|nr:MAG: hypothetical protein COW71_07770 [Ignavibacteriales bacterium CG18_big_fil_WC_8_21_14_2_50_31_20]
MKKIAFIILFVFSQLFAQDITWTEITSTYNLPDGVKLFSGERTSPNLKIFYYDVNLNNPDIAIRPYITNSIKIVPAFTKAVGAYGAINGGFFATGTASSYSSVVYPNAVKSQNVTSITRDGKLYPVTRSFFGQKTDGTLSVDWIYHFGGDVDDVYKFDQPLQYVSNDPNPKPAPQKVDGNMYEDLLIGIGGAPTLIKNSKVLITYDEEIMWGSGVGNTNRDPRTAVGYTNNNHVIMIVANGRLAQSEGVSLPELADIMLGLGCVEAMNLDGGGSSQLAAGDKYVSLPSERPVPTILAIVHKDSLGLPKTATFEKIIDTGDEAAIENGTGWFETANAGFYGETKSLLHSLGTGENYYEIKPNLPGKAKYEVYGWWVASSNRCTDTPHIIKHSNGIDTVHVDQSQNGSAWTLIGSYEFTGDSTESVIISDFGTQGNYIVVDAIRFVAYDKIETSIHHQSHYIVREFKLNQNYPNPFNPTTNISFTLDKLTNVNLSVFNSLGQKIETILDETIRAGFHNLVWNGKTLSSGIYFYRLSANGFNEIKAMNLIK